MEAKKKLKLSKETLAVLTDEQTYMVGGGVKTLTGAVCSIPCDSDDCNSKVTCKACTAGGTTGDICGGSGAGCGGTGGTNADCNVPSVNSCGCITNSAIGGCG
jgi:hypothetical protein